MHLATRLLLTCFLAISVATAAGASLGQIGAISKTHVGGQKLDFGDLTAQIARNYRQLKEKSPPGTTSASEQLLAGEQFDPNLGWYYLRARLSCPTSNRPEIPLLEADFGSAVC